MDKKIIESMRSQLSPDDRLIAQVLERAEKSASAEKKEITDNKPAYRSGGFVRSRAGIAAAAAAVVVAVGAGMLALYNNGRLSTGSSSPDKSHSAESIADSSAPESAAGSDSLYKSRSSDAELIEYLPDMVISGAGKDFRGITLFNKSDDALSEYAKALNSFKESVGEGVDVINMLCPTAAAYYLPDNATVPDDTQHEAILSVGEQLKGVNNIDLYYHLWMHRDEDLYLRTDHRWTPLAAYYAMVRFNSKAGDHEFPSIENFNENKVNEYVGTLYDYSGQNVRFLDNPEKLVYYSPSDVFNANLLEVNYWNSTFTELDKAKSENNYLTFAPVSGENAYSSIFNEGDEICEIKTVNTNGKTLLVVRDSFGYPAVPFLVDDYEKIYCVDIRYLGISLTELVRKVGAGEVLFLVSVPTANTLTVVNSLRENLGFDVTVTGEQRAREAADQIVLGTGKEKADKILTSLCDRTYQSEPGSRYHVIYGDKIYFFGKASITFSCVHDTVEAVYLNFGVPDFEEICLKKSDDEQRAITAGGQIELGMSTEAADRQLEAVCDRVGTASGVNSLYSQGMFSKCYYFGKAVILFSYSDDKVDGVYLCLGSPDFIETEICLQNTDPDKRGIVYQVETKNYQDVTSSS